MRRTAARTRQVAEVVESASDVRGRLPAWTSRTGSATCDIDLPGAAARGYDAPVRRLWPLVAVIVSCAGTPPTTDAGQPVQDGGVGHASAALRACAAFASRGDVSTIFTAVERLNALPAPVTPACFVASLPRPLDAVATISVVSAQPAAGRESPRVFLLMPGLVVSVVPDGDGASLLEFAEWTTPLRTLKGELKFPVTTPLALDAPLTRVHSNLGVTSCGLCHRNELPHDTIDGGFVSDAFRPDPGTLVPISELAQRHAECPPGESTPRCEMLHALFDFGALDQGAFSPDVALFVQ